MSRLIEIDSQVQQEPEPEGYKFGYYVFDSLPDTEVNDIELTINSITDVETKDMSGHNFQGFPIDKDTLQKLQHNDIFCKNSLIKLKKVTYNNVGKFNLPHIWDRVLINTPGLKLNK